MIDLKLVVKDYILENLFRKVKETESKSFSLRGMVVDSTSAKMLSSCFTMDELAAEGITFIDSLDKYREPYPTMEGVYLINPTEINIKEVISDIQSDYFGKFNIFFTEACPEGLVENLMKKIGSHCHKIKTLAELNTNFLTIEKQVFTLAGKKLGASVFKSFYQPSANKNLELGEHLIQMAEQLATLCSTLGESPSVRYCNNNAQNEMFATLVRNRIDEYKSNASDKTIWEGPKKAGAKLLILDRGFDTKTCLLHDLTYQAMSYDLLEGSNMDIDTQKYKSDVSEEATNDTKTKPAHVLDGNDRIWVQLRHKHISQVLASIKPYVIEIKKMDDKMKNNTNAKDLKSTMKQMPQHLKMKREIGIHTDLATKCSELFNAELSKLVETEQNLATATDADGKDISSKDVKFNNAYVECLLNQKISSSDKIRMLMLYQQFKKGLSEDDLKKYMSHANIPMDQKETILKLGHLNNNIVAPDGKDKKEYQRGKQKPAVESLRHISRWNPILKDVIQDLISCKLDPKLFPFVDSAETKKLLTPPVTSARRGSGGSAGYSPISRTKQASRVIIFVLGGVTLSECRVGYEVTEEHNNQWDILIGGTHLITPKTFLGNLSELDNFTPLTEGQKEKRTNDLRKTIKRRSTQRGRKTSVERVSRKISVAKVLNKH